YLPCSRQSADLLYNIISRRHESRSLVLTTNLPFKQWSTVFPGAACVSALIDRSDVAHGHPGVQRDEADARVAGRRNGRRRAGREKGLRSNHKGHPRRRRGCAGDHRGCAGAERL
ncbi:MAG TPA: ATP-binding protein, partial [Sorangium sp.]|nr:ATP-binding protein [Sorangium sp.]